MKPIFWRMLRRVMLIAVALPLVALAFQAVLRHTGNFHEVIAGELYRSAQPSAEMLRREAARFGIRTVVNLRGAHPGKAWYEEERHTAEELGITFIDFPMSANRELPVERAHELITRLRDELQGCIGCGCLSMEKCPLINPSDVLAAKGDGAIQLYRKGDESYDSSE